ncbi:MAG: hypothetical protein WCL21_20135, partial [Mariniphaga sp.]
MEKFRSILFLSILLKRIQYGKSGTDRIALAGISLALLFLVLNLFSGCYYYRAITTESPKTEAVYMLIAMNKTFVVHSGWRTFVMDSLKVTNDSLKGVYVGEYRFPHKQNAFPEENASHRYWKNGSPGILNEVHVYLHSTIFTGNSKFSFSTKDISRLDVYEPDSDRTVFSWVAGIVGGIVIGVPVIFFIVFLILAMTGASCPYIYVNTGNGYAFAGEIYSGAVYPPLERNDYLCLPQLVARDGKYLLKITNELKEIQHTNFLELFVFDHPANTQVLVDKYGNTQTIAGALPPVSAVNFIGTDILNSVRAKDSLCYYGVRLNEELPLTDGVIMAFDHPGEATSAKLIIRARNSMWLENVYKNFNELFGSYNTVWANKMHAADSSKLRAWSLSQQIPLSLYIEKNGEWVFYDYFNMTGPMAFKDDVLSLELKDMGEGPLKIKLESGSYFWEIDYVGLDYSKTIPCKRTKIG